MFTRESIINDIKEMGINPCGTLLVHSSMKSVGEVEGGADAVLDAFSEYMKEGLLIFPTHTWSRVGYKIPYFDAANEPACVGILPNLFRKREGVVRSLHPTHSVAALGRDAEEYTSGEELSDTPCPRTGCWGRLYDRDATILFLGCTLKSNTFIHGVEEWNEVDDRLTESTQPLTIIAPDGKEYHIDMHRHHSERSDDISDHYDKLEAPFLHLGAIRYGRLGNAKCIICNARMMADITSMLLKKNPQLFVNSDSVPEEFYK